MKYFRVEMIDKYTGEVLSGHHCAAAFILTKLGFKTSGTAKDIREIIDKIMVERDDLADPLCIMFALENIPTPDVFGRDPENHVCLYTAEKYEKYQFVFKSVDILLEKLSDRLKLVSKEFDIDDDEIIYRDPYQIVISWETYERHKDKHEHQEIPEIDKDLIICTFDGMTDDEIEPAVQ